MSELNSANPLSLDEYMNTDPEALTDEAISAIVRRLREMRVKWQASEQAKSEKPRKVASKSLDLSGDLF